MRVKFVAQRYQKLRKFVIIVLELLWLLTVLTIEDERWLIMVKLHEVLAIPFMTLLRAMVGLLGSSKKKNTWL